MENPWSRLPSAAPYILEEDRSRVERHNARADDDTRIELGVHPLPFIGDPRADVVLLLLSPGTAEVDPSYAGFREYHGIEENLKHRKPISPFLPLDLNNRNRAGSSWWREKVLKHLLTVERMPGTRLATRLFAVQYFPYWCRKYVESVTVPSQAYGFHLVRQAISREALIITMYGDGVWRGAVDELATYCHHYTLRSPMSGMLSPKNCPDGYPKLVARLT